MTRRSISILALAGAALASGCGQADPSAAGESTSQSEAELRRDGAVFTMSNEVEGNRVFAFARGDDGKLAAPVAVSTQGAGSGDSLGSQGAVALSDDGRWLLAVNAGSNDISVFSVAGASIALRDRVASGGARPISVTERRGLVYVLNAGAAENITGFFLDATGHLHMIPGSTRPLSSEGVGPAQVEIDPTGREVVVTEKASNQVDTFRLTWGAWALPVDAHASAGKTPFGFEFTHSGYLIVSEAVTASMSSYALSRGDGLDVISSVVPDTQAAPCWVAISRDDRFAYTANAGSASISSYAIDRHGAISLVAARAGEVGAGSKPLDLTLDANGRHLYALDRGNAAIVGFGVRSDGGVVNQQTVGTLPPFATGLVAY